MNTTRDEFIFDSDDLIMFCSNFDKISETDHTDSSLEVMLQDLNDRWVNVQKSYRVIFITKDDDLDCDFKSSAQEKYGACTKSFHKCKAKMLDLQKSLVSPPNNSIITVPSDSFNPSDSFSCIKVPPCDTENFQGGYEDWPSFRDMFTAVYINHPKLSSVQKLYHLRLKVKGAAAGIVRKYKLCGENFSLAWEALRSRYENKRILVDNQLKILLNLRVIASESSESLQKIQSTINDCLAALKAQDISTKDWDPILVYLCSTKLPHETLSLWEQSLKSHKELPKWADMDMFLSNRYEVVERLDSIHGARFGSKKNPETNSFNTEGVLQSYCKLCDKNHFLKSCQRFRELSPQSRNQFVSQNKICLNCLSYNHIRKDCKSKFVCMECRRNHHTLLHFPNTKPQTNLDNCSPNSRPQTNNFAQNTEQQPSGEQPSTSQQVRNTSTPQTSVHFSLDKTESSIENTLLPTAIVTIKHRGDLFQTRAFLDQGSEKTFVSKRLQQRLLLPTESKKFQIRGIGGHIVANSSASCTFSLFSESHDQTINIEAIVVPKITRLLPSFFVPKNNFLSDDLDELNLADPHFHSPGQVDLLLGSNVIPSLLLEGVKTVCKSLIAQATIFGWVISGPVRFNPASSFALQATEASDDIISQQLRQFWEQEEVPAKPEPTAEDKYCENLFLTTTVRDPNGRYVVKLPFKENYKQELPLGHSRSQALVQYIRMEQSMLKKPDVAQTYHNVLNEYLTLGHMIPTTDQETYRKGSYSSFYLPHHAVVKPESRSTKVRVVFNASKQTSSGRSLNDVLHVGPTLQSDLMTLILRWRVYKYVFSGDIEKMYRQILVHNDDVDFQRILFRPTPTSPIKDYALKTVTFGVNCAPYLAIRTLNQLAQDSQNTYPKAAKIILNETYVDDILSGAHDTKTALDSLSQLMNMLNSAGFPLKKITSNCPDILHSVPKENILDIDFLKFYETSGTKTLGIQWNALHDEFTYKIIPPTVTNSVTKRKILSTVSKLFDPAGWISPIIVQAKILLQQLWMEGINWDENVKPFTLLKWNSFIENLNKISQIKIPRWLNFDPLYATQIHGFCDASEKAYCAVIYLRIDNGSSIHSHLLVSKTRIAPIDPVSLPRLELCGAVMLSDLVNHVITNMPLNNYDLFLWSDSSITLGWLAKPPSTWKTYIANRVAKVIRNVGNCSWRHVRSNDNPADLGSRGCSPDELAVNSLWWHGPKWLQSSPEEWPESAISNECLPEYKKVETFHISEECFDVLKRFSRWDRAIRVIAYMFRFYRSSRKLKSPASLSVSQQEFIDVKNRLILLTQKTHYPIEYKKITTVNSVPKKSSLYPLNPFIDNNGIMRVSGRITNANIRYNERHPIILPANSEYTKLFIDFTHKCLLHAENSLMLRTIREEYYISRLRSAIKKYIRQCKICIIYKQKAQTQIMAALPMERSTFSPPFTFTGLDFAGPFPIKTSSLRQASCQKGYVCVFLCFSTKAIHLELCSDLSSDSFLAAFTRFVGRRGLPKRVMSDNGTNFVGAERKLRHDFKKFLNTVSEDISTKYASHCFEWSFIPPNAPHMGGLWEAGVKSFKKHFKKVTENKKYTFEEFATLLIRIEAVLNSRPLSTMSDDPFELLALTPGHFLRGAPMVAAPEAAVDTPLLDRWEKLKSLQHQFAIRWKDEYLKELQRRYKWQRPKENLKANQLVVVKDDQLPPCEWRIGRVKEVYQGRDGYVRVANIRTANGTITRDITRLCPLPSESQSQS